MNQKLLLFLYWVVLAFIAKLSFDGGFPNFHKESSYFLQSNKVVSFRHIEELLL
jgi:hypothetical protein